MAAKMADMEVCLFVWGEIIKKKWKKKRKKKKKKKRRRSRDKRHWR